MNVDYLGEVSLFGRETLYNGGFPSSLFSFFHLPQSLQLQKGITCSSVSLQKQKCNIKLYAVPVRAFSCRFASTGSASSRDDLGSQRKHIASAFTVPNGYQRAGHMHYRTDGNSASEFEGQLDELFNEVRMLIVSRRKSDAVELLQANYEAVKEQMESGACGIEQAAVLDIVALGYITVGDLKFVASILDILNNIVDSLKDNEPFLDSVLLHMGSMYSTLKKLDKSVSAYKRAIDIIEKKSGKDSSFLITPILGMAKVLGTSGKTTKAVEFYHRAISILESIRGFEDEDLVIPLFSLGNLLLKEGKGKDAETCFARIVNIYKKLYGEKDGKVGMAMYSLANAKCARGEADEAITLYRRALQIIKDSNYMALDDSEMEKMRIDLAELLHAVGRGKEGRELLEECLLINEKSKGKDHPSSVKHLVNLAASYSRSKNYAEAERLLRIGLDIMVKAVGPDDQSITNPMLNLAVTLYNLKRDDDAEQLALEVLRIRENAFGKDCLPVGEALDCLVSIQSRLGKDETELLKLLKRILRIQEKAFGYEAKEVIDTLKKIVFYMDKLGLKDEKFPVQKRLSLLRMKFKNQMQY
ncbi:nephrocystin-3 isoform X2 [Cucurbita maxima]|uniref:Nephrocystin-3 isoform X2 n=1 Tax=Cucurbita maxima TaxID=3661 RepID=A0A6J1K372_CUCMA|nr:nephrocystin-3 isoform X2 [Cucurbita maxima]